MPGPENSKLSGCPVKTAHGQQWRLKGTTHALDSVRRAWHARLCATAGVAHVAHGCRWLSRHARKGMQRRPASARRDLPTRGTHHASYPVIHAVNSGTYPSAIPVQRVHGVSSSVRGGCREPCGSGVTVARL
ncbi:hypothetical protein F511_18614 [Dorcoceras hygrometricum]|uniref:Uncharacterized protein n=1 Tax=Dorcoceras hygrometricum TaxID=472368 RepID=A0A2Z7A6C2_9LAMI|nr:hypothetical protein F511_18614 [Dorcoceras hygrometricum]